MFTQYIIAALAVLPLVAQSAFASTCSRNYTVQDGDICDRISAANNASTYQLATVNAGVIDSTCSNLQVGSSICLGTTGEDCTTTHVVVANETCDGISSAAGINSTILFENNPQILSDCSNIYVGEVLCTASSVTVPVAASSSIVTAIPATASAANPSVTASATSSAAATTTATDDSDSDDDDDLPWCDEL